MKFPRFINRILLAPLAFTAICANACWYETYEPDEYLLCRLKDAEASHETETTFVDQWRALLPGVDTVEIKHLIFGDYSINEVKTLELPQSLKEALTRDAELHAYTMAMLETNAERQKVNDPWYYYYKEDPKLKTLDSLARVCQSRLTSRYGDRYAVLEARALMSLRRYGDLQEMAQSQKFADPHMRDLFRQYYAGALYNLEEYEQALAIFTEGGDCSSMKWCLKKLGRDTSTLSIISELAKDDRNYAQVIKSLSDYIRTIEVGENRKDCGELINTSRHNSLKPSKYQWMWRYAEGIGHLLKNDYRKADSAFVLIESTQLPSEMKRSLRAIRFITQSYLKPYDKAYLRWVSNEADWLIGQDQQFSDEDFSVDDNVAEENRYYSSWISFCRDHHYSIRYCTDMLHRAADCIIVPRMLEAGDTVAALQLLDVVDFANFPISGLRHYDRHGCASACFAMECGANIISKTMQTQSTPIGRLWAKHGSIRNKSRWYDMLGTLLIGEGRYKEAVKALSKVDAKYAAIRSSVIYNTHRDPFKKSIPNFAYSKGDYYKLWFAGKMVELEKKMGHGDQIAGLQYAIGQISSVTNCWSLTKFGTGETVFSPYQNPNKPKEKKEINLATHDFIVYDYWDDYSFDPHTRAELRDKALYKKARKLLYDSTKQLAHNQNRNKEAAKILADMGYYRSVKKHFADTEIAENLRSRCDRWQDW